ncbi:MAG: cytochrome c [Gemmatimonadaceae bacterium]
MSANNGRSALPALCCLLLAGCPWFTDFKDQPRIEPWEAEYAGSDTVPFRGNPQLSVPIHGSAAPGLVVSYTPAPATLDSMRGLVNPLAADERSVENGRKYYQINCAVCHGVKGDGQGPVLRYGIPAPSLLTDNAKGYPDGYIFGIIRNGRGLMPTYDRIEEADRWDVVNYVRGLQGRLGAAVSTEPAGQPGENGRTVPSFTTSAPTRPSPYFSPASSGRAAMTPESDEGRRSRPTGAAPYRPGGATDTTRAAGAGAARRP